MIFIVVIFSIGITINIATHFAPLVCDSHIKQSASELLGQT